MTELILAMAFMYGMVAAAGLWMRSRRRRQPVTHGAGETGGSD